MTQDDRMETITDPEQIRAVWEAGDMGEESLGGDSESGTYNRSNRPPAGPRPDVDNPWALLPDDHPKRPKQCGGCGTKWVDAETARACERRHGDDITTPAPVGAAVALDLDAVHETICDNFTGMAEVRQAADALVAEVRSLRANWRMVTTALGYGDGITEPQIEHRDFVAECERQFAEASEWRESQRWRDECHDAGHPDDEDCYEHDPALVLLTLRAKVSAVQALAEKRDVLYPPKWAFGAEENYCNGYRQARADFIAAMATGEGK